jgi:hypothetical protein
MIIILALVISSTTMWKIYMARLPFNCGLAVRYLYLIIELSKYICSEYLRRIQLYSNCLIYLYISASFLHSSLSAQCRYIWAPVQFTQPILRACHSSFRAKRKLHIVDFKKPFSWQKIFFLRDWYYVECIDFAGFVVAHWLIPI